MIVPLNIDKCENYIHTNSSVAKHPLAVYTLACLCLSSKPACVFCELPIVEATRLLLLRLILILIPRLSPSGRTHILGEGRPRGGRGRGGGHVDSHWHGVRG